MWPILSFTTNVLILRYLGIAVLDDVVGRFDLVTYDFWGNFQIVFHICVTNRFFFFLLPGKRIRIPIRWCKLCCPLYCHFDLGRKYTVSLIFGFRQYSPQYGNQGAKPNPAGVRISQLNLRSRSNWDLLRPYIPGFLEGWTQIEILFLFIKISRWDLSEWNVSETKIPSDSVTICFLNSIVAKVE